MSAAEWVPDQADVAALRTAAAGCAGCELHGPATQTVFSAGNPRAPLMLVGEQPGDVEDREGIPFVGPAGRLLQEAVDEAGIERTRLYVTNAVKHFRFELRGRRRIHQTPQIRHLKACRPWLSAEIAAVAPDLIVCLGAIAAKTLLGNDFRLTQDRGRLIDAEVDGRPRRLIATAHPSAVLRTPAGTERDEAYAALVADLRTAAAALEQSSD
ncbi:UdgX family uracil-DNA binding protein [Microlunatus aurantiacus]|uniref:Type-4 uracil-DNA glycosylase n=1 Tax=Microlunatus aurantiacus TaxID=446786 RepID=A0ABP7E744_9ACTN